MSCFILSVFRCDKFGRTSICRTSDYGLLIRESMRNLFSMALGGILLFVAVVLSSCATDDGGVASNNQRPTNGRRCDDWPGHSRNRDDGIRVALAFRSAGNGLKLMTTIIGLSGSLRRESFNSMLLHAASQLAPAGTTVEIASIRGIPLYDGDLEAAEGIPARGTGTEDQNHRVGRSPDRHSRVQQFDSWCLEERDRLAVQTFRRAFKMSSAAAPWLSWEQLQDRRALPWRRPRGCRSCGRLVQPLGSATG